MTILMYYNQYRWKEVCVKIKDISNFYNAYKEKLNIKIILSLIIKFL